ncbi:LAGLIDADG family homing endonuclease [Pseudidiomarina sp.]|uniref:LAGLIDADG family homing endonuclease n=1 Tax=Pseudidiomarina sp. TaxID=2081707 RepID=UPI003A9838CF
MTIHIKKRWTEEEIKKIIDAYENGIPAEEIAVSLDRSSRSVRGKAFCLNLINRKHAEKHYTIEEDDYIRQHAQSMVRADIAKTLGRTEGSVSQRGRRLGVIFQNKKKNTKYQKKYDFFETPNLQNSYVAGLLAADGWVKPASSGKIINQVGIALKYSDAHLLEYIRDITGYTGNIRDFTVGAHLQSELRISGVPQWLHDLEANWNLVPCKSYILTGPTELQLNKEQLLAYLVGLIEGDGHICDKNKTLKIEVVTASPRLADWLENTFERLVEAKPSRSLHSHGKAHYIGFYGANARKLSELLMSIGVHRLMRKWSVAAEHLDRFS